MQIKRSLMLQTGLLGVALFLGATASAQITPQRRDLLKGLRTAVQNMSPSQRAALPSGMRTVLAYAAALDAGLISPTPSQTPSSQGTLLPSSQPPIPVTTLFGPGGTIRVSSPALDFNGSVLAGFSENTTSSARCGNSVVVGFEDTGALLATFGASINGVASSADGGNTFIHSLLNIGTDPTNILFGEPAVACSSPKVFYYASVLESGIYGNGNALISISLSTSVDGGRSWGPPIPAISANPCCEGFGRPWLAVDPSNPLNMYISFTDGLFVSKIQVISSHDGGKNWSAPVPLEQTGNICGPNSFPKFAAVDGAKVNVGPGGEVYVAWEFILPQPCDTFNEPYPPREIHFARSLDHGATFTAPNKLAEVTGNGDAFLASFSTAVDIMEGGFFANEYPQLAVDRTNGPSRGTLYITWSDGKNNVRPDPLTFSGVYAYPDIVFAKSTDKGLTFTAPVSVSPQPAGFTGPGRDQFFPGIAVDPLGRVAICYYDRRNDSTNMSIDRYCSVSLNHGAGWLDLRASSPSWLPNEADAFTFFRSGVMGEYDALTSDFLQLNPGFFGAFMIEEDGNPNIVARKF
jgi:hypothetical protein